MNVEPVDPKVGGINVFSSAVFAPAEPVSFWFNTPNGNSVPLRIVDGKLVVTPESKHERHSGMGGKYVLADYQGFVKLPLEQHETMVPGVYSLVAHGNLSGFEAVSPFVIK